MPKIAQSFRRVSPVPPLPLSFAVRRKPPRNISVLITKGCRLESTPKATKRVWLAPFARSFLFLFATTSVSAFALYFGVKYLQGPDQYFAPIFVFDGWHGSDLSTIAEHPFPFLLSISFLLALLAAAWIAIIAPKTKRYQGLQALLIPWITVILASPIWGVIWSIYRWPPEGFSDPDVMWLYYRHDAMFGLDLGWVSALLSFPINILSFVLTYALVLLSKKVFLHEGKSL